MPLWVASLGSLCSVNSAVTTSRPFQTRFSLWAVHVALFLIRRLPNFSLCSSSPRGLIRHWAWLRSFAGFYRSRIERRFGPMYFLWGRGDRRTIYIYIYIYGLRTAVPFMWGSLRLAPIMQSWLHSLLFFVCTLIHLIPLVWLAT